MITSFKELKVWERADDLAFVVFDLAETFPRKYLYDLTSQLRRAALSVPTNIAEGCASFHSGWGKMTLVDTKVEVNNLDGGVRRWRRFPTRSTRRSFEKRQ